MPHRSVTNPTHEHLNLVPLVAGGRQQRQPRPSAKIAVQIAAKPDARHAKLNFDPIDSGPKPGLFLKRKTAVAIFPGRTAH